MGIKHEIKQLALTGLLILAETCLFAQNKKLLFGIGSSLDFNSCGLIDNLGPIESNGKIGYSSGLVMRYKLNDKIWLGTRILYSIKKYEERIDLTAFRPIDPSGPLINAPKELIYSYSNSFIETPLGFGYKFICKSADKIYQSTEQVKAKYINPFTDFGFKKIFGEEASKPLLLDFLNALLPQENKIIDLLFKNTEQLGQTDTDRKAIYDIYCENENGEKSIVELQKAEQNYFKERTIYYSTFPIREQAEKGEWTYNLKAFYCIGILDFTFGDYESEPEKSEVVHTIKLKNQRGKTLYDKLTYIYLEMPNFNQKENELNTRLDKWLFFIKHLEDFQTMPIIFKDEVFIQAFEKAAIANFGQAELDSYENSLKTYRDLKGVIDSAFGEGKTEVARNLVKLGTAIDIISKSTGLTKEEIEKL